MSLVTLVGAEAAAPTTLATSVRPAKSIRVVNSAGAIATLNVVSSLIKTAVGNNASLQSDVVLADVSGLALGDVVVNANVPADTTISSIDTNTNTITLSAALTGNIIQDDVLTIYRSGGSTTLVANEVLYTGLKVNQSIYASAATVLLTPIGHLTG